MSGNAQLGMNSGAAASDICGLAQDQQNPSYQRSYACLAYDVALAVQAYLGRRSAGKSGESK